MTSTQDDQLTRACVPTDAYDYDGSTGMVTVPIRLLRAALSERRLVSPVIDALRDYLRYLERSLNAGPLTKHPGREGALLSAVRAGMARLETAPQHTCHDMNPPFPGSCAACEDKL